MPRLSGIMFSMRLHLISFVLLFLKNFLYTVLSNYCCTLTLDRVVNQRFSAHDAFVKINGSNHVVEQKFVGVIYEDAYGRYSES